MVHYYTQNITNFAFTPCKQACTYTHRYCCTYIFDQGQKSLLLGISRPNHEENDVFFLYYIVNFGRVKRTRGTICKEYWDFKTNIRNNKYALKTNAIPLKMIPFFTLALCIKVCVRIDVVYIYVYAVWGECICIYHPACMNKMWHKVNFWSWVLSGLNSAFSFSLICCHTKVKENCLPFYLAISVGRAIKCILK